VSAGAKRPELIDRDREWRPWLPRGTDAGRELAVLVKLQVPLMNAPTALRLLEVCMSLFNRFEIWNKACRARVYRQWLRGARAILPRPDLRCQRNSVEAAPSLSEAVVRPPSAARGRGKFRSGL